jgi:hypothetical protein
MSSDIFDFKYIVWKDSSIVSGSVHLHDVDLQVTGTGGLGTGDWDWFRPDRYH